MNGPQAPLRRSHPPRRPAVSVPDASKKPSGATCPTMSFSANSTPMPPLHPRHLAPYADAPPVVSDAITDLFQQASPMCPELAMATRLGSWTTMMSDETDVDEISLPMPLHDLGTQTKVTKAKRAGNYTLEEGIQLCMSWENISTYPIVANEQPGRAYWQRIADHYHAHRTFESDRNANSLEHCWSTIQKDCLKFQGFFDDIERRHPSGIPYKEHILEAQAMFAKPPQKKPFQFLHCWLKVRRCQKFQSIETNKRPWSSRSSTPSEGKEEERDEGGRSETPDSTQPILKKRPIGRKQAKARLKTGGDPGPYKEAIEELILDKKEQKKLRRKNRRRRGGRRQRCFSSRRYPWKKKSSCGSKNRGSCSVI